MKKVLLGMVLGSILTTATGVFANDDSVNALLSTLNFNFNGKTAQQDSLIYNNKTYVPIRFVGEQLGKEVGWDTNSRTVSFSDLSQTTSQPTTQQTTGASDISRQQLNESILRTGSDEPTYGSSPQGFYVKTAYHVGSDPSKDVSMLKWLVSTAFMDKEIDVVFIDVYLSSTEYVTYTIPRYKPDTWSISLLQGINCYSTTTINNVLILENSRLGSNAEYNYFTNLKNKLNSQLNSYQNSHRCY